MAQKQQTDGRMLDDTLGTSRTFRRHPVWPSLIIACAHHTHGTTGSLDIGGIVLLTDRSRVCPYAEPMGRYHLRGNMCMRTGSAINFEQLLYVHT
jgi:hypothetical protein